MSRLGGGTAVLVRRYRIWLWSDGVKAGLVRTVGGLALGAFTGGVCLAAPVLLLPLAAGWTIASWHAARPPKDPEAEPEQPACNGPTMTAEQARTFLINRTRGLIGPRNGVHLDVLLAQLIEDGVTPAATTVADLRRDLTARGIPTRDSLKVAGAVRVGVHRDDLQPFSRPLPDPALAKAG